MKRWIKRIWEAPQKALAHIIIKLSKAKIIGEYEGATLYHWTWPGGMSLSTHIFLPFEELTWSEWQTNYVKHEYGHTIQSEMLGPLYLLIIALPSVIWAGCFEDYRAKKGVSYYAFYTERWANNLTGAYQEED